MQTKLTAVLMFAVSATACSVERSSPTGPSAAELAQTPSAQAPVISIAIMRESQPTADGQIRVTLGENFNRGLSDEQAIDDWNGANVRLIKRCNGRESFVIKSVQSGDYDQTTRKAILVFTQVDTCSGQVDFRLQASPYGSSTMRDMTFPRGVYFTSIGYTTAKDASNGHIYIRGNTPQ